MASRNLTIDIDDRIVTDAERVLSEIGLDLQTYIKTALMKLIREKGIPFSLSASQTVQEAHYGMSSRGAIPLATEIHYWPRDLLVSKLA
jgi:addiction module RelB/DinJ family antitoxin